MVFDRGVGDSFFLIICITRYSMGLQRVERGGLLWEELHGYKYLGGGIGMDILYIS